MIYVFTIGSIKDSKFQKFFNSHVIDIVINAYEEACAALWSVNKEKEKSNQLEFCKNYRQFIENDILQVQFSFSSKMVG